MSLPTNLDELVAAVQKAPRYRTLDSGLVRWIGEQELERRRSFKEAVKATRSRLHQVAGAYLPAGLDSANLLNELARCGHTAEDPALRAFCLRAMARHASTRERLPILESFFERILAPMAPLRSVLDLACGLNPLALPWMPLAPDTVYYACDVYTDLVDFLNNFLQHIGRRGAAGVCDLTRPLQLPPVQVALLLKSLPCLEQLDKHLPERLLETIPAEVLVVSFPVHSLGGGAPYPRSGHKYPRRGHKYPQSGHKYPRSGHKGMSINYGERFERLTATRPWRVERIHFATELVFVVQRRGAGDGA